MGMREAASSLAGFGRVKPSALIHATPLGRPSQRELDDPRIGGAGDLPKSAVAVRMFTALKKNHVEVDQPRLCNDTVSSVPKEPKMPDGQTHRR